MVSDELLTTFMEVNSTLENNIGWIRFSPLFSCVHIVKKNWESYN